MVLTTTCFGPTHEWHLGKTIQAVAVTIRAMFASVNYHR